MFLYSCSKNFRVENFPSIEYPLPVDNDAGATAVGTSVIQGKFAD